MTYFPLRQTTCFFIPLVAPCKPLLYTKLVIQLQKWNATVLLRKSGRLASQYAADDKLDKVLENPQVIKTPVVRNGKQSTLGYLPDVWKNWN